MSLRTRLLVWIGSLFFLAFVASFYFEFYFTKKSLITAEKNLEEHIEKITEYRRKYLEDFMESILDKAEGQVDSLLSRIGASAHIREGFAPSLTNLKHNTWLNSTSLMITDTWIDFVQNFNEDTLMSIVVNNSNELYSTISMPLADNSRLVLVKPPLSEEWEGPYIAVAFNPDFVSQTKIKSYDPYHHDFENLEYYIYYNIEEFMKFDVANASYQTLDLSLNFLEPFIKWINVPARESFMKNLLAEIKSVQEYVKANYASTSKLVEKAKEEIIQFNPDVDLTYVQKEKAKGDESVYYSDTIGSSVKDYIDSDVTRYDKIGMTMGLASVVASGMYGFHPLAPQAPNGLIKSYKNSYRGVAVAADQVFLKTPFLNRDTCKEEFTEQDRPLCVSGKMFAVSPPNSHISYFGNSLQMQHVTHTGDIRTGYLTIGINGKRFLSELSKATHLNAMFVLDGRIVNIVDPEGNELLVDEWLNIPIKQILSKKVGSVDVDNIPYYFLHIRPYASADFHFLVFLPRSEEFELVDLLNKGSAQLISDIATHLRISGLICLLIVLVALDRISKKVTKPITRLARATKHVGEGHYEDIDLPDIKKEEKDEIATLYHSFLEMINGLKEKEKVRGVLNKVVSQEIAEETLKGNIHLGGEVKRVTVMFADIRNFTKLTETMKPKEVIDMLNACMTKISHIIDVHGGVIDKYVGDEVMALFGAPVAKEDSALKAVGCAIEMVKALNTWNEERVSKGLPEIRMGIGIHTGEVVAGNMGADNRLNYTVLGSNVNLASRLCSAAEPMQILITENTKSDPSVTQKIQTASVPELKLKGISEPVRVYTVEGFMSDVEGQN